MRIVPPGDYFLEYGDESKGNPWEFAIMSREYNGFLRPLTLTEQYAVTTMRFRDNKDQEWMTDDRAILQRV